MVTRIDQFYDRHFNDESSSAPQSSGMTARYAAMSSLPQRPQALNQTSAKSCSVVGANPGHIHEGASQKFTSDVFRH